MAQVFFKCEKKKGAGEISELKAVGVGKISKKIALLVEYQRAKKRGNLNYFK